MDNTLLKRLEQTRLLNETGLAIRLKPDINDAPYADGEENAAGVIAEHRMLKTAAGDVPIRLFRPDCGDVMPGIVCFSVDAFGDGAEASGRLCQRLSAEAGAVVALVDAGGPDAMLSKGCESGWQALCWVRENSGSLLIDPDMLAVLGAGLGASLASACCLMDQLGWLKLQLLVAPSVLNCRCEREWERAAGDDAEALETLSLKKELLAGADEGQWSGPLVNPFLARDFSRMPTTLVMTAEHDYLRCEAEEYARRMQEDGTDVIVLRYAGAAHGFYRSNGSARAQDSVNELAKAVRSMLAAQ